MSTSWTSGHHCQADGRSDAFAKPVARLSSFGPPNIYHSALLSRDQAGAGIDGALSGIDVVLHFASPPKEDVEATRNLARAAMALGKAPGLPWTILRATQFYAFIYGGVRSLAKLPVVPVPAGFLTQPIHPDDVAAELVRRALAALGGCP